MSIIVYFGIFVVFAIVVVAVAINEARSIEIGNDDESDGA